jgi:hypothetical protein
MAWLPFPFPKCVDCGRSWETCRHLDCRTGGTVELDPDTARARCSSCAESWGVHDTTFRCACGYSFTAVDVEDAIDQIIEATRMLAVVMEQHRRELAEIRRSGQSSFDSWLTAISQGIGSALGAAADSFVKWLIKIL